MTDLITSTNYELLSCSGTFGQVKLFDGLTFHGYDSQTRQVNPVALLDTVFQGRLIVLYVLDESNVVKRSGVMRSVLPKWWSEKYKDYENKYPVSRFSNVVVPSRTVCKGVPTEAYKICARRRDQDGYSHVTTLLYMEFCLDALEYHLNINHIDCDINTVSLLLKSGQYLHKGESKMGDMLTVAFWDDDIDNEMVCFDITKEGQSIYQARLQFYGKSDMQQFPQNRL